MPPSIEARAILEVANARNGHARRWAVQRAHRALVAGGTSPAIAASTAQAAAAVGQQLQLSAAAATRHILGRVLITRPAPAPGN